MSISPPITRCYLGTQMTKYVKNSDVLFFIDTDVPWEPPNRKRSARRGEDYLTWSAIRCSPAFLVGVFRPICRSPVARKCRCQR